MSLSVSAARSEALNLFNSYTTEEMNAMLARADEILWLFDQGATPVWACRAALLAWIGFRTGLRISEIHRLRLEDFDFRRMTIHVWRHKKPLRPRPAVYVRYAGATRDTIALAPDLAARIHACAENLGRWAGPLFLARGSKPASLKAIAHSWRQFAIGFSFDYHSSHALRHTFATEIAERSGGSVFAVNDALGHERSSIDISAQYVMRNPRKLRSLMESLSIDPETAAG
jgi:integrase